MSNQVEHELKLAEQIPPLKLSDLVMVQLLLNIEGPGRFEEFLRNFSNGIDFDRIVQVIEETRRKATSPNLYEKLVRIAAKQQFGDAATVLRELTQNCIDSYELGDARRVINFQTSADDRHFILQACDYGVGMSLEDFIQFLMIPFSTTKGDAAHKIGEHGIGWFSVIGISRLVKVRSRRRGTNKVAQVLIQKREHDIEALVSEPEADMGHGTEVTIYIPDTEKGLDRKNIKEQFAKYVGYVNVTEAEIFLDGAQVNTLASEYLRGEPAEIIIKGEKKQLIFSFSKRTINADYSDKRFDERNKNLQQIVYTQSGLFLKYGSNPFDNGTIHAELLTHSLKLGLDFWIEIPETAGLMATRNDFLPEHAPSVLEASYQAFKSLFLESIITDEAILYHPSDTLGKGVLHVLTSDRYFDHARLKMVEPYSLRRRILSVIMPVVRKMATAIAATIKYLLTAPFRMVRYLALLFYSLGIAIGRADSYKVLANALVVLSLITIGYLTVRVWRAEQPQETTIARMTQPERTEVKEPFQSHTERTSEIKAARPTPRTVKELPFTSAAAPMAIERQEPITQDRPARDNEPSPTAANVAQDLNIPTLIERAVNALDRARENVVTAFESARHFFVANLTFLPEGYRDLTALILLVWCAVMALFILAFVSSKALLAVGIQPSSAARFVARVMLFPMYLFLLIGAQIVRLLSDTTVIFEEEIGRKQNIEEKRRRAIEKRLTQIISKYRSRFQRDEFARDVIAKEILNVTKCEIGSHGFFRPGQAEGGHVPGRKERISIARFIELFAHGRIRYVTEPHDRVLRAGDYFIDIRQGFVKELLKILEPMQAQITQKYDPVVLEDALDEVKQIGVDLLLVLYFLSGLGVLHIAVSLVYRRIPNPYENTKAYQMAAEFVKQIVGLATLKFLALAPFYAVFYLIIFLSKQLIWPLLKLLFSARHLPSVIAGAFTDLCEAYRKLRRELQEWRAEREQERKKALALKKEAKRLESLELLQKQKDKEQQRKAIKERLVYQRVIYQEEPHVRLSDLVGAIVTALKRVGRSIIKLATEIGGKPPIDQHRLGRVIKYARVGQNYSLLLDVIQNMDALLSDSLRIPKLKIWYVDTRYDKEAVIGSFKHGKKPRLELSLGNTDTIDLAKNLDSQKSKLYFTLLECLLHHKTHQAIQSPLHEEKFYERKEEMRAQFYNYMQKKDLTVESYMSGSFVNRRRDQMKDFVPPDELVRLSKFRTYGLLKEREKKLEKTIR
jgi:hypothetical protein